MASLGNWSDDEIRRKLVEYNIPIVPLTDSTRKVLVQRIKKVAEEKRIPTNTKNLNRSRRSLAHFSSGEDTDENEDELEKSKMPPPSSNHRNNRRQTTVGFSDSPSLPVAKSRRSDILRKVSVTPSPEVKTRAGRSLISTESSPLISPNITLRRKTRRNTDDYDNGSDSDVSNAKREIKTVNIDQDVNNVTGSSKFLSRLSVVTTFMADQNNEEPSSTSVDSLLSFRKHSPSVSSSVKPDPPFVSNFARRLSAARESRTFGSTIPRTSELFKVKDTEVSDDYIGTSNFSARLYSPQNGHFSQSSRSTPPEADMSQQFQTTEEGLSFWNSHFVPKILVIGTCIFFAILAIVYMNIRSKEVVNFTSENQRNIYPVCPFDGKHSSEPCIKKDRLQPATYLMRLLHPELTRRAIQALCGPPERDGTYVDPIMTERILVNWLTNKHTMSYDEAVTDLRNLKVLLIANPHWGLKVVGSQQKPSLQPEGQLEDVDMLVNTGSLMAVDVALPTLCHVKQKALLGLGILCILSAVYFVSLVVQKLISWNINRCESAKQEVFSLVQGIIELLEEHHRNVSSNEMAYLSINNVRDQLIPPQDRMRLAPVWDKAVNFLDCNESRLRTEVQQVAGEFCPVWRWLPINTTPVSASSTNTSKPSTPVTSSMSLLTLDTQNPNRSRVWQEQAFVTEPGAPNGAPQSPTECLKLRHMFDQVEYGDDWPGKVRDALLEKCGDAVKVLHLVIDKKSNEGCVYIKCLTKEDAGVAYRALHGWWFDSKLVTVKYIRLERYHQRFPDAVHAKQALKPSNNKRLSLATS